MRTMMAQRSNDPNQSKTRVSHYKSRPAHAGTAVARTLDSASAASHVEVIKRFGEPILAIALLSAAAVGVVALKGAIWISHFNY